MKGAQARAAAAACWAVLMAAGAATGCSGPVAQPAAPAAPASQNRGIAHAHTLTQHQLEQAVLGPADGRGWQASAIVGRGGDGLRTSTPPVFDVRQLPPVSPAACAPLERMLGYASGYQVRARVVQTLTTHVAGREYVTVNALVAYRPADAAKVLGALRTSLRTCGLFKGTLDHMTYTDPRTLPAPHAGDDALAYGLTQVVPSVDDNGDPDGGAPIEVPLLFEVVRRGATVAVFYDSGITHRAPVVPAFVVARQMAKLDRVS